MSRSGNEVVSFQHLNFSAEKIESKLIISWTGIKEVHKNLSYSKNN